MKNFKFILLPAVVLALYSCSQNTRPTESNNVQIDTLTAQSTGQTEQKTLFAKMEIKDTIRTGELVQLKFTIYNNADSTLQFCKWHTPFEPLMSKYLDIKDENGEEVAYKGPMAKRIMPPPANSYIKVNAKDSLSSNVDLLKAYAIQKPAKYTITYTSQNISGLVVTDSVSFVYIK